MRTIAFINQKGGSGKTTSAVNLGALFALKGNKVLLVDMDPQGNATSYLGWDESDIENNAIEHAFLDGRPIKEIIRKTAIKNLWLVPNENTFSSPDLVIAQEYKNTTVGFQFVLDHILKPVKKSYDYIIIDCPPNLGVLSINGLVATEGVIIPFCPDLFNLKGVMQLEATLYELNNVFKSKKVILGMLATQTDFRKISCRNAFEVIQEHFTKETMFKNTVRANEDIRRSFETGPVVYTKPRSIGAIDYNDVYEELRKRIAAVKRGKNYFQYKEKVGQVI